jgi:hypothetical protein
MFFFAHAGHGLQTAVLPIPQDEEENATSDIGEEIPVAADDELDLHVFPDLTAEEILVELV